MSDDFPHRNGFARRRDLEHPVLRQWLELCLQEHAAFSGEERLGWSRQWEYPFVLANLPAVEPEGSAPRILEAGSGYRFLTPLLARRGFEVHACDLDARIGAKLDALATRESLPLHFAVQDLESMSYPDAHFDAITCVSVLEHTPGPERVAAEFARCLKPGGRLVLTFDVSPPGDRDIPVPRARSLVERLELLLAPARPFADRDLLASGALGRDDEVLRTGWFRANAPELLPWRRISRVGLAGLLRGRLGRPFFDLAVIGIVLEKSGAQG